MLQQFRRSVFLESGLCKFPDLIADFSIIVFLTVDFFLDLFYVFVCMIHSVVRFLFYISSHISALHFTASTVIQKSLILHFLCILKTQHCNIIKLVIASYKSVNIRLYKLQSFFRITA